MTHIRTQFTIVTRSVQPLPDEEIDHRYTVRVYLLRSGRPRYWQFHCVSCGKKLCEVNGELLYMTDITNDSETSGIIGTNRIRCNEKHCRFWYEFNMN